MTDAQWARVLEIAGEHHKEGETLSVTELANALDISPVEAAKYMERLWREQRDAWDIDALWKPTKKDRMETKTPQCYVKGRVGCSNRYGGAKKCHGCPWFSSRDGEPRTKASEENKQ